MRARAGWLHAIGATSAAIALAAAGCSAAGSTGTTRAGSGGEAGGAGAGAGGSGDAGGSGGPAGSGGEAGAGGDGGSAGQSGSGGGGVGGAGGFAGAAGGGGAGGFAGAGGAGGSGGAGGAGGSAGAAGAAGAPLVAEVYGHSPDTLYKLDPITKAVTVIGGFQGCSQVIDIALDASSKMYATTFGGLYQINRFNAACSLIAGGTYPNSLSFVPKGTVDPNVEALVGYDGSTYVRIDPVSGAVSTIGAISGGYVSSGDIVSVIGGKTLLTVSGPGCGDCIVEVNPTTGDLIQNWGSVGHSSVFGLAFWAGAAYGFDDYGELFQITFGATTVTTSNITIPNAPSGLEFWGAGSTTSAPRL